jgi:putative serine protease PepD
VSSLPPPAPGVSPGIPAPAPRRRTEDRKRRNWAVVVAVGVVAWTAALTGALVGNQLSDWIDSPPKSASDEPINVSDPTGPIEGRLDVAKVIDHMAASVVTISADVDSQFGQGQSTGTGVIVSSDGEILTNALVVE